MIDAPRIIAKLTFLQISFFFPWDDLKMLGELKTLERSGRCGRPVLLLIQAVNISKVIFALMIGVQEFYILTTLHLCNHP